MKNLRMLVLIIAVGSLAACSSGRDLRYLKQAKTTHPVLVPTNASAPKVQNYYTVPKVAKQPGQPVPVSLVPPGSKVFKSQKEKQAKRARYAGRHISWVKLKNGAQGLDVPLSQKKAWASEGRALRATPYRVLDQDNAMGSYYVLDTQATHNKITKKTPIYRLQIQKISKNKSQLVLTNKANQPIKASISKRILGSMIRHMG